MPFISGGGGGTFTGGTIHKPLAIEPTDPTLTAETITQPAGSVANATDWLLVQNENGDSLFEGDATGYLTIRTLANNSGFRVRTTVGGTQLSVSPSSTQVSGPSGGALIVADNGSGSAGAVYFDLANSAPADGQLGAGQFALWFDSTNGAAALNIKAKQANGTVKTATIPVIT